MKTTIITGATRGIGKAIATKLMNNNHRVINISNSGQIPVEFKSLKFESYASNLSNIQETQSLVNNLLKTNKVDNVVLNAGITDDSFFHKMKPEQWCSVINTNLLSTYGVLYPIINQMRENNSGNIVFISSINAHRPVMGQTNYAASKAGILALSRCLAIENSNKNIRSNVVSPGYIETEMTKKMKEDIRKRIENDIPLKRFGTPDEIANIVYMLVNDNSYFQGSNIDINGGLLIR